MKDTLSKVVIFASGVAIGSLVTWKLIKTKYEQIAQEEIDSVKEVFSHRKEETESDILEEELDKGDKDDRGPSPEDIRAYHENLSAQGYVKYSDMQKEKEVDEVDKPYVISPEEFGELDDYEKIGLTYYADGALATDDTDELVDDVENIVGIDSLETFGEYEDDAVHVRNDRLKCDYEILRDLRNYSDVVK